MERIQLKAQIRKEIGKKHTKQLRKNGLVPAVVYKEGKKTVHLGLSERDLIKALHTKAGENVLINLKVEDASKTKGKDQVVIVKEVQQHPIREQILHVDFQEISLTEKLTVNVPVAVKGEAEGVVKDEGVLEHVVWEIKVECLPADIPEKIEVEVTAMKIGDRVLVKDLHVPPGVKILDDPEQSVIAVEAQKVEEVAPPPEEEIMEPELIRKEKEEVAEEGAEDGAPEKAEKGEKTAKPEKPGQDGKK